MDETNRLQKAARHRDWRLCEHLLRKRGANPNALDHDGLSSLFYAVQSDHEPTVRLMLSCGADPNAKFLIYEKYVDVLDISAFFHGSPQILELLLRGRNDPEASELRACSHFLNGNLVRASVLFFWDGRVRTERELFARFVEVAKRRLIRTRLQNSEASLLQDVITELLLDKLYPLEDGDRLDILSHLVQDKDFSYFCVSIFIYAWASMTSNPSFNCDLLKVICSAPLDREQQPRLLYALVIKLLLDVLHSAQSEELIPTVQVAIDGFEAKKELLLYENHQNLHDPILVRFLLESCGCDPNARNQNGDSALHALLRHSYTMGADRPMKIRLAQILLAHGAHPCSRNARGVPAFELLSQQLGISVGVRNLRCLAASKMAEVGIEFRKYLPKRIHNFVELHY